LISTINGGNYTATRCRIYHAANTKGYWDGLGISWDGYSSGSNRHIGNFLSNVKPDYKPQTVGAVKVIYQNNQPVTVERSTVGGVLLVYQFPSIPTSVLATAKATTLLTDTNKTILIVKAICNDKGAFQVGQSIPVLYNPDSDLESALGTLANYFIIAASYDDENAQARLTLSDARVIPRPRLTTQIVDDKIVEVINNTNPTGHKLIESSDPADPADESAVMWLDSNGDLKMKITHGAVTKTATIVDYSGL